MENATKIPVRLEIQDSDTYYLPQQGTNAPQPGIVNDP
jgi:hypothetical protein